MFRFLIVPVLYEIQTQVSKLWLLKIWATGWNSLNFKAECEIVAATTKWARFRLVLYRWLFCQHHQLAFQSFQILIKYRGPGPLYFLWADFRETIDCERKSYWNLLLLQFRFWTSEDWESYRCQGTAITCWNRLNRSARSLINGRTERRVSVTRSWYFHFTCEFHLP